MKITRKLKVVVGATAIGAATTYLMDPELGRQRRNRLAEAVERRSNDVRHLMRSAERVKEAVTPTGDTTEAPDQAQGEPAVAGVTATDGSGTTGTGDESPRSNTEPAGVSA